MADRLKLLGWGLAITKARCCKPDQHSHGNSYSGQHSAERHFCSLLRTNPLMAFVTQDTALQRFWAQLQHYHTSAVHVLPKRIGRFWAQKRNLERLSTMVLDSLVEWLVTMCCRKICKYLRTNPLRAFSTQDEALQRLQ